MVLALTWELPCSDRTIADPIKNSLASSNGLSMAGKSWLAVAANLVSDPYYESIWWRHVHV